MDSPKIIKTMKLKRGNQNNFGMSSSLYKETQNLKEALKCAETQKKSIEDLPNEITLMIFNLLLNSTELRIGFRKMRMFLKLSSVCQKWQELCFNSDFSKKNTFKFINTRSDSVEAAVIGKIISKGAEKIRITNGILCGQNYSFKRAIQTPKFCSLIYLNLGLTKCDSGILENILLMCKDLVYLNLQGHTFTDNLCNYIALNGNLKTLEIHNAKNLTTEGLSNILQNCMKVEDLNLCFVNDLDWNKMSNIIPASVEYLGLHSTNVTNINIKQISLRCRNITFLDLYFCNQLRAGLSNCIGLCMPKLENLNLSSMFVPKEEMFHFHEARPSVCIKAICSMMCELNSFNRRIERSNFQWCSNCCPTGDDFIFDED